MKRIWLAVVLGLILGVGLGFAPQQPTPRPAVLMESNQVVGELNVHMAQPTDLQDFQWIAIAMIVGLALGLPVLFLVSRRTRS